jgi:putative CocE/NonD family hydrolase
MNNRKLSGEPIMPGRTSHSPRSELFVAAFAALAVSICSANAIEAQAAANAGPPKGKHEVTVRKNEMIPMRDGIRLATDIYLPAMNGQVLPGRHPTIMSRTPYSKDEGGSARIGNFYASHGYAVVMQDVRGRFKSEGNWVRFVDDPKDGADTSEWLARQPWSNGEFGMTGCSYVGGTQHVMAMTQPTVPGLKTVIVEDATSNEAIQDRWNFGVFAGKNYNWMFTHGVESTIERDPSLAPALTEMMEKRLEYIKRTPLRKGTTPLKFMPEYEDWIIEAAKASTPDHEFWKMLRIRDEYGKYQEAHLWKDIPAYFVGGWYDSKPGHTTGNFVAIGRKNTGPNYLHMGPWIHCQRNDRHGQISFGEDAVIDRLQRNLTWFNRWLKGEQNEVGKADPFASKVRIFVMGTGDGKKDAKGLLNHGGYWRNENEWPLARARMTPYYFHEDGSLSAAAPVAPASSTSYDFDPRDPVPNIGGNVSNAEGIQLQGGYDQKGGKHVWNWQEPIPLSHRKDVLVFQTEPLEADVEVTGDIQVKLYFSSSALDTDFTAKLLDIYPSSADFPGGFDLIINDGVRRARYHKSLFEEDLLKPNEVYEMMITLYPTSNVFKKGHRIRVDISSSNFPRYMVNPNTGEPIGDERRIVVATNSVHHDRVRPSHIILPIVPARR